MTHRQWPTGDIGCIQEKRAEYKEAFTYVPPPLLSSGLQGRAWKFMSVISFFFFFASRLVTSECWDFNTHLNNKIIQRLNGFKAACYHLKAHNVGRAETAEQEIKHSDMMPLQPNNKKTLCETKKNETAAGLFYFPSPSTSFLHRSFVCHRVSQKVLEGFRWNLMEIGKYGDIFWATS